MAGLYHEFLAHLKNTGIAKSSHFQVSIPVAPKGVDATFATTGRLLSMRCETTELPGRQLVTQDNRIYGPLYKTPYQSLYQEITLNFLETSDFFIRRYFEAWIDVIFNVVTNRLAYPNTYRSDITLTQFDVVPMKDTATLATIANWHLVGAFPTAVNQMPVSWTEDGLHRVTVTLAYEYYLMSRPSQPKPQLTQKSPTTPIRKGSSTN